MPPKTPTDLPAPRPHGPVFSLVSILCGCGLYAASFHPFDVPELAYIWAIPLLVVVSSRPSRRSLWWGGLLGFWLSWLVLIPWLRHVHWSAWLLLSGWSAVFPALWLVVARDLLPRAEETRMLHRLSGVLAVAAAWVLLEWVRTILFTGWGWLPLAATQWQRPAMLQLLPWTGQWGLSFVLIIVNTGLFLHGRNLLRMLKARAGVWRFSVEFYAAMGAIMVCFVIFLRGGMFNSERELLLNAAIIQPYIKAEEKWGETSREKTNETLVRLTRAAAALPDRPDTVLWPEAGTPDPFRFNGETLSWVEALSAQQGVNLLAGAITVDGKEGDYVLRSGIGVVSPTKGMEPEFAAKRHLVPFGEYIPLRPVFGWLKQVVPIGSFTPGDRTVVLPLEAGRKGLRQKLGVGSLVCYEDVFTGPACDNVLAGADFHFVVTNNAWYGEEWGAKQHAVHSALRAAETRRPVVRCGNAGWSGWFDEYGVMRAELTRPGQREYFQGVESVTLDRDPRFAGQITFYVLHGDWFVALSACLTATAWLRSRRARTVPTDA